MFKDVVRYLRGLSNDYHFGVAKSFLEDVELCEHADTSWTSYRLQNRITSRGCAGSKGEASYEQMMWTFINEHYPIAFRSMNFCKNITAFRSTLKSRGILEQFRRTMGDRVDFLNSSVDNGIVLTIMHAMTVVVLSKGSTSTEAADKSFLTTIPKDDLDSILLIMFEFAAPPI
jgi:hypothetical protein